MKKCTVVLYVGLLLCANALAEKHRPLLTALSPQSLQQERLEVSKPANREKRGLILGGLALGGLAAGAVGAGLVGAGVAGVVGAKAVGAGLVAGKALGYGYGRSYGYGGYGYGYGYGGRWGGYGGHYYRSYPSYVVESYW